MLIDSVTQSHVYLEQEGKNFLTSCKIHSPSKVYQKIGMYPECHFFQR